MENLDVIEFLEAQREDLLKKLTSIDLTILTIKQSLSIPSSDTTTKALGAGKNETPYNEKYKGYVAAKSNRDKVIAILKAEGKFLHIRQIVNIAKSLEPKANPESLKTAIAQATYNLKTLENSPIVTKNINNSNQNTFWGSKSWLNENGEIKLEHKYDEDQIMNKNEKIEI